MDMPKNTAESDSTEQPKFSNAQKMRDLRAASPDKELVRSDRRWPDDSKTRDIADVANLRIGANPTPKIVDYAIGMAALFHEVPNPAADIPEYIRRADAHELAPENDRERRQLISLRDTDPLTGLGSRLALDKALPAAEADPDVLIANFDANNFGQINKLRGELAGDAALVAIANAIQEAASRHGYARRVFRRGGDEFIVLASRDSAVQIVDEACRIFDERIAGDEPFELPVATAGTDGDEVMTFDPAIFRDMSVSLSGTVGQTFAETSLAVQAVKAIRKTQSDAK